ncbi:hypothetical protein PsYK624_044230 [Phanerochaete sordida]|uniref:Uncharacterized protein n=1 Tax=Phanerochaete sordida TaxID=48140 RepID=A0A9P3G5S0_9APHY|nr:hypothetical protein PsYK624_044230 [Phanerochaete sordida]
MRPPLPLRSLTSIRTYATRLPERPPYRAPDPLVNNPNAAYEALPDDLTFIHRPPPSAPSPESYTTLPTSPLLKPVAPAAAGDTALPPALAPRKKAAAERMSQERIAEMQRLRAADPAAWTAGRLAKAFGCTQHFARIVAPLAKPLRRAALAARDAEHAARRERWGEKKLLQREVVQKRKEFW